MRSYQSAAACCGARSGWERSTVGPHGMEQAPEIEQNEQERGQAQGTADPVGGGAGDLVLRRAGEVSAAPDNCARTSGA